MMIHNLSAELSRHMTKDNELVIVNPLLGTPFKQAPDGTPMEGLTFKTRAEMDAFIAEHWSGGVVEMVEVPVK